ncbi:MAG: EamA family transporter [Rhodobacteraceae bacterium]|nr:EamA family transporter [Paracoccaceae bacterium]
MTGQSDNMKGALLMMASMAAFTLNDACIKALSGSVPFFQIVFLRGVVTLPLFLALGWWMGALKIPSNARDRRLLLVRTLAEIGAVYFFLNALFNMPIANATAILAVLPLAITLAGALFFAEPVGWRRIVAICVGMVGVLIIIRPGAEGFTIYSVYAAIAVVFVVIRDLSARRLSGDASSVLAAVVGGVGVTVFAGFGTLGEHWVGFGLADIALLIGAAVFILVAYVCSVMTMRVGEIGVVTPLRYTNLLWALLLGFVFFDEWPDPWTLLGAGIIVATGVFTLAREHASRRS